MVRNILAQVAVVLLLSCIPIGSASEPEYRSYTYATAAGFLTGGFHDQSDAFGVTVLGGTVASFYVDGGSTLAIEIEDLSEAPIYGWWSAWEVEPTELGHRQTRIAEGSFCSIHPGVLLPETTELVKVGVSTSVNRCDLVSENGTRAVGLPTTGTVHVWIS